MSDVVYRIRYDRDSYLEVLPNDTYRWVSRAKSTTFETREEALAAKPLGDSSAVIVRYRKKSQVKPNTSTVATGSDTNQPVCIRAVDLEVQLLRSERDQWRARAQAYEAHLYKAGNVLLDMTVGAPPNRARQMAASIEEVILANCQPIDEKIASRLAELPIAAFTDQSSTLERPSAIENRRRGLL